jgi:hypothetical protein
VNDVVFVAHECRMNGGGISLSHLSIHSLTHMVAQSLWCIHAYGFIHIQCSLVYIFNYPILLSQAINWPGPLVAERDRSEMTPLRNTKE